MQTRANDAASLTFDAYQEELEAITVGGFESMEVTLTLKNFLGGVKTSDPFHLELSSETIPNIKIVGGNNQVASRYNSLSIEAKGSATACDGRSVADRSVTYEWKVERLQDDEWVVDYFKNFAANPRYYKVDEYQLEADATYRTARKLFLDERREAAHRFHLQVPHIGHGHGRRHGDE